jgi:DNA-binding NtrC family response regulator
VDNDQGILESFDVMLSDDFKVVLVDNSSQALNLLCEHRPRLLFLDIKMPRPNGLELLKSIREKGLTTTVVIVTALPQTDYHEIAAKYGIYRYLKKPLDVNEVENIARQVLN